MKYDTLSIKHIFDNSDLAGMAKEQADKFGRMNLLEAEAKGIATGYKAKIEEVKAGIQAVSVSINYGFEMRNYRCLLLDERPEGHRICIRLDNGRIAKKRKLAKEERQMTITETAPDPYVAIALLPVDDDDWATDLYQCPVTSKEFEELKPAGVNFMDYQGPLAAIEGAAIEGAA